MGLRIAQVATADMSIHVLLMDQICALEKAGHKVTAVCSPGPFVDKIRAAGVRVETIPMSRELSFYRDWRSLCQLRDLFRREKFDVVHTHTPKAGLIGPVAARLAGVPLVVHTIHGLMFHDRMPAVRRCIFWAAEKWTATFAHRLLSQSQEDVNVAVSSRLCSAKKIAFLGNGVDVDYFTPNSTPSNSEGLVIGSVGRLVAEKGFPELFEAAQSLSQFDPKLRFVVVGPAEPDQNDAISKHVIDELVQKGIVEFAGWNDDMRGWYSRMDMFVLPSHREGIPRACMEAAAMGLPVVATDIRGCREVVKNGDTGILVPLRDPEALAGAIRVLASDAVVRRRMGTAGREHVVQHFQKKDVLERLCSFYREIENNFEPLAAHA